MKNLSFDFTSKYYRSNINCYISVTNTETEELVFHWQFYVDLDIEKKYKEDIKNELQKLEEACNSNDFDKVKTMMSDTFTWNCIWYDYIELA